MRVFYLILSLYYPTFDNRFLSFLLISSALSLIRILYLPKFHYKRYIILIKNVSIAKYIILVIYFLLKNP